MQLLCFFIHLSYSSIFTQQIFAASSLNVNYYVCVQIFDNYCFSVILNCKFLATYGSVLHSVNTAEDECMLSYHSCHISRDSIIKIWHCWWIRTVFVVDPGYGRFQCHFHRSRTCDRRCRLLVGGSWSRDCRTVNTWQKN